ncbi:BrnT family toxin [Methylobacterium oxalidis]|uniref:BrnT family toxin n=1 Tax=Methylobacterium oxalidis TaxID=944322 RepID=UPI0033149E50
MAITFDPAKRTRTLAERGLDFRDAETVFAGTCVSFEDERHDYGEVRVVTIGRLIGRMVILIWTPRGADRHIISMRKANDREQARYAHLLG